MKWKGRRQSTNVRRGGTGRKAGGVGIGGIVIGLVLWLVFDMNPMTAFQTGQSITNAGGGNSHSHTQQVTDNSRDTQFVATVLADTEDVWHQVFQEAGKTYKEPQMVLFDGVVQSACGSASSATGPFYCPADQKVYLDTSFFADMSKKMGISGDQKGSGDSENHGKAGDFAQAYVIAHEVGHHIQTITGISPKVRQAQKQAKSQAAVNELSVRQELQADCFAGVWANRNQQRVQFLQDGDIEEALHAASMIGDDRLAHNSGRVAVPDNFTHGSSEQRVYWFKRGLTSGDMNQCNTFSGTI